jgi:hypothetical protein
MKRVINKALSIFSPSKRSSLRKRPVDEFGSSESPSLKKPKRVCDDLHAHLDAIERLQSTLLSLDKACSKEQLEIQRKYDAEKAPLLLQRRIETNKIPSFWATALGNHPATNAEAFLVDREILDFLTSIDLEDNIDDNGSYQLRFIFDSSCNPFFPQSELVRTVTILDDQTDQVTCTPISWAPGKRPKHPPTPFLPGSARRFQTLAPRKISGRCSGEISGRIHILIISIWALIRSVDLSCFFYNIRSKKKNKKENFSILFHKKFTI